MHKVTITYGILQNLDICGTGLTNLDVGMPIRNHPDSVALLNMNWGWAAPLRMSFILFREGKPNKSQNGLP